MSTTTSPWTTPAHLVRGAAIPRGVPVGRAGRGPRAGFSLVELLVACGIIGLLLALLLPAMQGAREAARRTQCRNNLRQLALAMLNHESLQGRFPANGWGHGWLGEPDRGSDEKQPGGWAFSLLPHLEQKSIRDLGRISDPFQKPQAMALMAGTHAPVFNCPTRPGDGRGLAGMIARPINAHPPEYVALTDYAVNEGDYITDTPSGPASLEAGDDPKYPWTDVSQATGVAFLRSRVRMSDLRDGASQTLMLGEKYVSARHYTDGGDPGYDQSAWSGVDWDINRWTIDPPLQDGEAIQPRTFGSAHAGGPLYALCDGSVRDASYVIDREVHRSLGNRQDGGPVGF